MSNKAVLVLVYNHRYDKNIPILEEIYGKRFSSIFHLVPFYDGSRLNVIPVYENSHRFQGYIAQGFKHYFKEDFARYLFVADDLLLHPSINEDNLEEWFGLDAESSFIPHVFNVHCLDNERTLRFERYTSGGKLKLFWWRLRDLARYQHRVEGLENSKEMPAPAEAEALLQRHGYSVRPLKFGELYGPLLSRRTGQTFAQKIWSYAKTLRHYRWEYPLNYPAVAAFSDVAIVPGSTIKKFAHYCGVFAANGLFVEFALPTALVLSAKKVVTEAVLKRKGAIYWNYTKPEADKYAEAMQPYQRNLHLLLRKFPAEQLYIHPIKLSQWTF